MYVCLCRVLIMYVCFMPMSMSRESGLATNHGHKSSHEAPHPAHRSAPSPSFNVINVPNLGKWPTTLALPFFSFILNTSYRDSGSRNSTHLISHTYRNRLKPSQKDNCCFGIIEDGKYIYLLPKELHCVVIEACICGICNYFSVCLPVYRI